MNLSCDNKLCQVPSIIHDFFSILLFQISRVLFENDAFCEVNLEILFPSLIDYFKIHKSRRTLEDLENILGPFLASLNKRRVPHLNNDFRINLEGFIERNNSRFEVIFFEDDSDTLVMDWILTYEEAVRLFFKYNDACKMKDNFALNLLTLLKCLFLVVFRIIEQILTVLNREPYSLEKEREYLIQDIVYLENIQRSFL